MRAVLVAAPGSVELVNLPDPTPTADGVVVEVAAVGICGTDLHIYKWDPWASSRIQPPRRAKPC